MVRVSWGWFAAFLAGQTRTGQALIERSTFKNLASDRHSRVHYLTKFACGIGECKYRVRAGVRSPTALVAWAAARGKIPSSTLDYSKLHEGDPGKIIVRLVLDDEWERSHNMAPCDRLDLGRGRTTLHVPLNGSMSNWVANTFRQSYRPHFWYFFAEDCGNSVIQNLAAVTQTRVENYEEFEIYYEIIIEQVGGGHLSFEYKGMLKWNIGQLCCYAALMVYSVFKQRRILKRQGFHLHIMTQILNASLIGSIWGSLLHSIHLWTTNVTGSEILLINTFADTCFILSQVAISSCLILISMGVTLNAPEKFPIRVFGMLGAAIVVAHVLVVVLDKYVSDSRYKHYVSEGPVGWVLIVFRCSLWGIFVVGWYSTGRDPRTPPATERFLRKTLLPASFYFLAFPLLLALASLCKPYWRHAVFYHLTFVTQAVAVYLLSELFLNKGEYFKVSTMSQSFLPGGVWKPAVHHVD